MNKKLRIKVDGKIFDVDVEVLNTPQSVEKAEKPKNRPGMTKLKKSSLVSSASVSSGSGSQAAQEGDVPSPLSGRVVSVHVAKGQKVTEGENMITLEAMKMNTYVVSPKDGVVEELLVQSGDTINEGQVLVRLK